MTTQNERLNSDNNSNVCSYDPQRQIINHGKVAPESRRAFLCKAASVMLAALGAQPLACRHKESTWEIQPIVRANNKFALVLYAKIRNEKGNSSN